MKTYNISSVLNGILHFIFPQLCAGCGKSLMDTEHVLCIECNSLIPQTNYHHIAENETALKFTGRVPFEYATSFAYFTKDSLIQHLLHSLKYQGKKDIGIFLGKQFGYALKNVDWIKDVDILLPVPLHKEKKKERGFNQSILLAEGLQEVLALPIETLALKRIRNTNSQTHKTREERADNMKDAFKIVDATPLKNKHVLLIDDVLTTGATLEACAQELLHVSGLKLSIATIAIATNF